VRAFSLLVVSFFEIAYLHHLSCACGVTLLKVHRRIWSYHMGTDFFAPFPSPVDKWVFSIFSRDFKGSTSADQADSSVPYTLIPPTSVVCSPTFDEALDCTRRLCRKVCLLSLLSSASSHFLFVLSSAAHQFSIKPRLILLVHFPHLHPTQVPSLVVSTRAFNPQQMPRSRALLQCHAREAGNGTDSGAAIAWSGASALHAWEDAIAQLLGY
jgi:hypothetical protein